MSMLKFCSQLKRQHVHDGDQSDSESETLKTPAKIMRIGKLLAEATNELCTIWISCIVETRTFSVLGNSWLRYVLRPQARVQEFVRGGGTKI